MCISSALVASLAVHYFAYDLGDKKELGLFLEDNVAGEWSQAWEGRVGAMGVMSAHAAVSAIMTSNNMSELLKKCIAYTGDVDTVATIALAAGYFSKEIRNDLPSVLKENLEKGKYGQCFLEKLSDQILSYFNLKKRH